MDHNLLGVAGVAAQLFSKPVNDYFLYCDKGFGDEIVGFFVLKAAHN